MPVGNGHSVGCTQSQKPRKKKTAPFCKDYNKTMQTDKEDKKLNNCKGHEDKKTTSFGTWNITSLTYNEEEIRKEMAKLKVDILGIGETKKAGKENKKLINGFTLYYSGREEMKRVRNANNEINTKTKEVLDTWQDYNTRKFKESRIEEMTIEPEENELIETKGIDEITMTELEVGTTKIKIGKADGADQIEPDMIKKLGTS
ncbi:hypothetical protein ILUMI_12526 [Ignelater luminosus]|uniref:Uncharacterized protein n=1 Tax=Ignelater luminosus TaxID=2038154 RepID=A0A8K0CTZ5_IGNLU|nr:hypothetical protein ILUMI_12526 [Ignelater luminosus]